jgi:hypothetical protein
LGKIKDEIAGKSKFGGQLSFKLKKFKTNDQLVKHVRLQWIEICEIKGYVKEN